MGTSEAMVKVIDNATMAIEEALAKCNVTALAEMPVLKQAVTLAAGIATLRKVMSDDLMEAVFMPLQGSTLGFLTDRDVPKDGTKPGYPIPIVRDCTIEAMIRSLMPVNNEFNIISARAYAAKNGLQRIVCRWPGLTDMSITPGVIQMAGEKGAVVPMRASWRMKGHLMQMVRDVTKEPDGSTRDTRIMVKVNANMGADAIIGKATRKIYKSIYDLISGSILTLDEADADSMDTVGETIPASTTETLRQAHETVAAQPAKKSQVQVPAEVKKPEPVAPVAPAPVVEKPAPKIPDDDFPKGYSEQAEAPATPAPVQPPPAETAPAVQAPPATEPAPATPPAEPKPEPVAEKPVEHPAPEEPLVLGDAAPLWARTILTATNLRTMNAAVIAAIKLGNTKKQVDRYGQYRRAELEAIAKGTQPS